jgi:autotransporter-associated beta strand protein
MAGGTFIHENGNLYFGNTSNARGVFYMSGGRAVLGGDMRIPTYNATGCGVVTIAGEDASIEFINGKGIFLALLATNITGYGRSSMVNLNAGKLTANYIARHGWYSNVTEKAYVNFNGGTYRYTAWGGMFGTLTSPHQYRVDRVTSFEKGAVLELPNNCSSAVPISAPTGKGIKSISWSPLSGLSGSPVVVISDEDGVGDGASAFAFVDESGTVTNIQVTSPGWNYTSAKARLYCNRTKLLAEFDCVLEEQVSGGLTKTGGGAFTMNATNTYTGATVLKGGKIVLGHPDVIDARSELVLDGGTLDLNGMKQTFSSVRGAAGSVVNGTLGLSGLRVDLSDAVAGRYPEIGVPVVFAEGAEVSVLNVDAGAGRRVFPLADFAGGVDRVPMLSDEALDALPSGDGVWKRAMSGTVLKLYRAKGGVVTFR